MSELLDQIEELKSNFESYGKTLNIESKFATLKDLEKEMSQPGFWDSQEHAQEVVQNLKAVKNITSPYEEIEQKLEDVEILYQLAEEEEDEEAMKSVEKDLKSLRKKMDAFELQTYFTHQNDKRNAYFSIHAGAGGTESCDWAGILYRMYTRWMENHGFSIEVLDHQSGEEAGIKKCLLHIKGPYAFGYLKAEMGVHRLVRISPFDANNRRHTSFASVDVSPELDDIEIEVKDEDLRVDTYRASGAGGQHVNVTDSAVRITHLPSGIVVQCQNERSQHKNRSMAFNILKSRLYQREEEKREEKQRELYGKKSDISWGNQIRSYTLQPYTLVKDHRTGCETSNAQAVLEGEIEDFINAFLKWHASQRAELEEASKE